MRRGSMEWFKVFVVGVVSLVAVFPNAEGWGEDGHAIVCMIAQSRLSESAGEAVRKLLPEYAENELGSLCSWPDAVKRGDPYRWSADLHFADTPDGLCNYCYQRDCRDQRTGEIGRCVVGAIHNYTNQLLNYGSETTYNLTEALLFLSHFIGDLHQPLHCGFVSDRGGNSIKVNWYTTPRNLHKTAQVKAWENCGGDQIPCPNVYAIESVELACKWAYKDVTQNAVLEENYFLTRLPIVTQRLAQGGVRLAASLNRIFDKKYVAAM